MTPRRICAFTLIVAVFCLHRAPVQAADESHVTHAVFAANRLWLLTETGTLSSID
jgi:hypothetical protein